LPDFITQHNNELSVFIVGISHLQDTSGCRYAAILLSFCARHSSKWTLVVSVGWPGLYVRCISGLSSTAVTHTRSALLRRPMHDTRFYPFS